VDREEQSKLAERFRALHHAGAPLVLPNAWDAASANEVARAGFLAVATTSGGVAASLGWADSEQTPAEEMFAAVARIARAVDVPVSADIEAGYGLAPEVLAEMLIAAGAVGCNLEDTDHARGQALVPADLQAGRLAAVKEAASREGVDLVVNARIDVFIRQAGEPAQRVGQALERARQYADAGADCVYPIGADENSLEEFIAGFHGPVNAMARPGVARLSRLVDLGVARISFASSLLRSAMTDLRRRLRAIAAGADDWEETTGSLRPGADDRE
jgi:2-methylisocitrate lyase-like PEP mutase family enzyme